LDERVLDFSCNLAAACGCAAVSDPFVLMSDDFLVLKPWTVGCFPVWHRGPLAKLLRRGAAGKWARAVRRTREILEAEGFPDALAFNGLHKPMLFHKDLLSEALELLMEGGRWRPAHVQTVYGNLALRRGRIAADALAPDRDRKVARATDVVGSDWAFASLPPVVEREELDAVRAAVSGLTGGQQSDRVTI